MDPLFAFIENSALGEWIRGSESILAFPTIITFHAIGMAFLAGGSTAIDLRILGFAPGISLGAMRRFLPLLWLAFAINAISGTLLLIAWPAVFSPTRTGGKCSACRRSSDEQRRSDRGNRTLGSLHPQHGAARVRAAL